MVFVSSYIIVLQRTPSAIEPIWGGVESVLLKMGIEGGVL